MSEPAQPAGLTPDEIGLLDQALDELPGLLADAALMAGPRRADNTRHATTLPDSRPPLDLTLIAVHQTIDHAWTEVYVAAEEAGHTLPGTDDQDSTTTAGQVRHLALWRDWYQPCWWARNEVLVPLRQARTALRRITKPATPTTYRCPQCAGPAHTQAGELTWIRCADCGHDAHLPDAVTTTTAAGLFGITEPQVRQWAARGKITPTNPGRKPSLWRPRDIIAIIHPEGQIAG